MIRFEERCQNEHGIWVDRLKEMNSIQIVSSVDTKYQPFMKQYIIAWLRFVKQYQQNTDPATGYTIWDVYSLREKVFYPSMQHSISFSTTALKNDFEGLREVERKMRFVDVSMIDRVQAHYKRHEYGELPPASTVDLTRHTLPDDWKPRYNAAVLSGEQVLIVGPLILSWTVRQRCTYYEVHVADGLLLHGFEPVRSGHLRRFKDPIKRHVVAIKRVQELAALTDWNLIEQLSNKQQRSLRKSVFEKCKERLV